MHSHVLQCVAAQQDNLPHTTQRAIRLIGVLVFVLLETVIKYLMASVMVQEQAHLTRQTLQVVVMATLSIAQGSIPTVHIDMIAQEQKMEPVVTNAETEFALFLTTLSVIRSISVVVPAHPVKALIFLTVAFVQGMMAGFQVIQTKP